MKKILLLLITLFTVVSLYAEPKAVVFDFGGVMTREQNRAIVIDFIRKSFHLSKDKFEKVNKEKRAAIAKGMTDVEFWIAYARKNRIQLPERWDESFKSIMKESIGINQDMYVLIEELKAAELHVVLLSNIDERLGKLLREFGFYSVFDPCILSYEIDLHKPDLRIYEFLLNELQLAGDEVIFIDDKKENVEASKKLSIDAIVFESEPQLREELAKRGLLICK